MELQKDPRFNVDVTFNFEPTQEQRDRLTDAINKAIKEIVGDIPKGLVVVNYEKGKVREL